MAGGFCLISAVVLIIFLEETNYRRDLTATTHDAHVPVALDTLDPTKSTPAKDDTTTTTQAVHEDDDKITPDPTRAVHSSERIVTPWPGPRPWKMFTISPNARGIMLRGIVYPIMLMRHPIVLWCGLIYGLYQIFFNRESLPLHSTSGQR